MMTRRAICARRGATVAAITRHYATGARPGMATRPIAVAATVAIVAAILLASACASTPEPEPDVVDGCYYFERGAVAERLRLPWGVRLTPDTLTGWPAIQQRPGVRRATTLVGPGQDAAQPFGYWVPLDRDSLEIGYPAGGGLLLVVATGPTHLTGTIRPVGDALPPGAVEDDPRAEPVSLVRARCP